MALVIVNNIQQMSLKMSAMVTEFTTNQVLLRNGTAPWAVCPVVLPSSSTCNLHHLAIQNETNFFPIQNQPCLRWPPYIKIVTIPPYECCSLV